MIWIFRYKELCPLTTYLHHQALVYQLLYWVTPFASSKCCPWIKFPGSGRSSLQLRWGRKLAFSIILHWIKGLNRTSMRRGSGLSWWAHYNLWQGQLVVRNLYLWGVPMSIFWRWCTNEEHELIQDRRRLGRYYKRKKSGSSSYRLLMIESFEALESGWVS